MGKDLEMADLEKQQKKEAAEAKKKEKELAQQQKAAEKEAKKLAKAEAKASKKAEKEAKQKAEATPETKGKNAEGKAKKEGVSKDKFKNTIPMHRRIATKLIGAFMIPVACPGIWCGDWPENGD